MEIPIFIRFMLPDIYLPPRRSKFPVSIPRVEHADISPCSSPTPFQLSIPNMKVHGLGNSSPEHGGAVLCCATPGLADSRGASSTQWRHALQCDASATLPHDTPTFVPIIPAACFGAPHKSASDLAMEAPVVTIEATTDAGVGIAFPPGHTLSPILCSPPANFDSTPAFWAHCEMEKASPTVLQNMHCCDATILFVATDADGSDPQRTPVTLEVGMTSTGQNGLFVDRMRVTDEQAPGGIIVVTAAPMSLGIGNMGFHHLHTVPVYDCITATAPSYGIPLRGHDSGIRSRLSLPSLLTRYQPIDRGRYPFTLLCYTLLGVSSFTR